MNLKSKLMLLSTVWFIVILVVFNVIIYFFVIRITTKSEIQLLWNKAGTVLQKANVRHPANWHDRQLLDEFLVPNEMIRIIDVNSHIANQVYSNEKLLTKQPVFYSSFHSDVIDGGDQRLVYVQIPIAQDNVVVGTLEIGRILIFLNDYIDILVSVLLFASGGAIVLAVIGSFFYTRFLFRPIHRLVTTMQTIEEEGRFQKLDIKHKTKADELETLGMTFNKMIDRLEENFTSHKQFVADASHELKTPLTIIESYVSILKRWGSNDPDIRNEAIEAIESEAIRMKGLTKSLLDLMDAEREQSVNWERFSLNELIKSTIAPISHTFKRDIAFTSNGESAEMMGDSEKIKQLFIILLDNAVKYSNDDIEVVVDDSVDTVTVSVIDKGIGIAKEDLPHIFNRFYRVDKARNRKTGGVGLGLAIAKNIVQIHGGTIGIESESGKGTTLRVQFPKRRKTKIETAPHNTRA